MIEVTSERWAALKSAYAAIVDEGIELAATGVDTDQIERRCNEFELIVKAIEHDNA